MTSIPPKPFGENSGDCLFCCAYIDDFDEGLQAARDYCKESFITSETHRINHNPDKKTVSVLRR